VHQLWHRARRRPVRATDARGSAPVEHRSCDHSGRGLYNHRRAHLGIGSLVPADRFYGRWPEVVAEMEAVSRRRQGALALQLDRRLFVEPPAAGERVIALQLILVGDQAELHLGGRRVVLGKVLP
jgi:hypothetical protein